LANNVTEADRKPELFRKVARKEEQNYFSKKINFQSLNFLCPFVCGWTVSILSALTGSGRVTGIPSIRLLSLAKDGIAGPLCSSFFARDSDFAEEIPSGKSRSDGCLIDSIQ